MRRIYLLITTLMIVVSFISINAFAAKSIDNTISASIEYNPVITNIFAQTVVMVEGSSSDYTNKIYCKENIIGKLDEDDLSLNNITFNNDSNPLLNIKIEVTNLNPDRLLFVSYDTLMFNVVNLSTVFGSGYTSLNKTALLDYEETLVIEFIIKLYLPYKASMNFDIYNFNLYFG